MTSKEGECQDPKFKELGTTLDYNLRLTDGLTVSYNAQISVVCKLLRSQLNT